VIENAEVDSWTQSGQRWANACAFETGVPCSEHWDAPAIKVVPEPGALLQGVESWAWRSVGLVGGVGTFVN